MDLIKSAFAPGTQAAQAVLAYARICGVGEITQKIGSGYDTFERGMFEGRRSAMIDLMNIAGIDPLTAFKPDTNPNLT